MTGSRADLREGASGRGRLAETVVPPAGDIAVALNRAGELPPRAELGNGPGFEQDGRGPGWRRSMRSS